MKNDSSFGVHSLRILTWRTAAGLGLLALLPLSAGAASISKANNTNNLNLGSSWSGGVVPGAADTAQWDNLVTGANATALGADTNWAGIVILGPGGPVTITAGNTLTLGASGINMSAATADLALACGLSLTAANSWTVISNRQLSVSGAVTGTTALAKDGDGLLRLTGNNSGYSGALTDTRGGIVVGHGSALGTATATAGGTGLSAFFLEGVSMTVGNALTINGAAVVGLTSYGNLRNLSGSNTWSGVISGNASPRIGCDAGTLRIAGDLNLGSSTARTPTFLGAGDIVVSSVVKNAGSGAGGLDKRLGSGTLKLSGANTYKGATTLLDGTTILDFTTAASILPDTSALTLSGGDLVLSGGTLPEAVASSIVGAANVGGASTVSRSSGTSTLRMNAISRNAGGSVNFAQAAIADTDTGNVNGILGGYATVGGADWAANSTGAADGSIIAYTGYQTSANPAAWTGPDNVSLAGNPSAGVASTFINSLRLTGASTVQVNAGATLTLGSGGLLITGSGATAIAPASGAASLTGAAGGDLVVHQYSSADCTISAAIVDNGGGTPFTKAGPGRLILSGTNTFFGTIYITDGILSVAANEALGTPGSAIAFAGGTLQATATFNIDETHLVALGETSGSAIDVTAGNELTVLGIISGRGWLRKTGDGTLTLNGANGYFGDTVLNGGILKLGVAENAPTSGPLGVGTSATVPGVSGRIWFSGGTLQYSPVNSYDYSSRFSTAANQAYKVNTAGQDVTWTNALTSAAGSLVKSGAGTLMLSGASTYTGGTTVNGGTLEIAVAGNIKGGVTLTGSAALKLDHTNALNAATVLTLPAAPAAGSVALNYTGTQTINALFFGGVQQASGTWGASGSGAAHQDAAFVGGGILMVASSPGVCSSTNALLGIGRNLDGTFTLTFAGTPGADYYVLQSPGVTAPAANWTPIAGSTNTVTNLGGAWQFTVTNSAPARFYRSAAVSPCP